MSTSTATASSSQTPTILPCVGIGDFTPPPPVDFATVDEFFQLFTHFGDEGSETMLPETVLSTAVDATYCNGRTSDDGTDHVPRSQSATPEGPGHSHQGTTTPLTVKSLDDEVPKTSTARLRIADIIDNDATSNDDTCDGPARNPSTETSATRFRDDEKEKQKQNIDEAATESNIDQADEHQQRNTSKKKQREAANDAGLHSDKTSNTDNIFEIECLRSHQVDKKFAVVDFFVEWKSGATTWETERDLQLQVPSLVLDYWDKQGGREKVTGLQEFHVLRLLDYRQTPSSYLVQWVGYRRTRQHTTWESVKKLQLIAPDLLAEFEANRASKVCAKRRSIASRVEPARKRLRSS